MNDERTQWLQRQPQTELAKKLGIAAWILTALILLLVGMMRRVKIPLPDGISLSFLPPFHAAVNTVAAVVLVISFLAVIRGRIALHRRMMMTAMGLSVLFLLSYVAYHFTSHEVKFGDSNLDGVVDAQELTAVGGTRTAYLLDAQTLLLSTKHHLHVSRHTPLAARSLVFRNRKRTRHRRHLKATHQIPLARNLPPRSHRPPPARLSPTTRTLDP
jgi:putative membrane protein